MVSKLVDLFNQEHQGRIQAELIQGDWGSADTYLTAGVAGGGGIADVIEYYTGGAASWYDHHLVIDLRPYITDDVRATMPSELWQARTAPDGAVFESGTISGEPNVIYYNPALLAKAGIDPPALGSAWTWINSWPMRRSSPWTKTASTLARPVSMPAMWCSGASCRAWTPTKSLGTSPTWRCKPLASP